KLRGHDLKRGMPNGRAEEAAGLVRHLEEPTRPAPRMSVVFGVGQAPHHRQCFVARGGPVRQFHAFLVRHGALTEAEMEKVARHDFISSSTGKPQSGISFHSAAGSKHKITSTKITRVESLIGQTPSRSGI